MCSNHVQGLSGLAKAALAGKNSRQVGEEKDLQGLLWVYRWGYSSAKVIDAFTSPGRRGIAARLVKKGYLAEHQTDGGGLKGVPLSLLTMTQDGVARVEANLKESELLPYPANGDKLINWQNVRHDVLMQSYTCQVLHDPEKKVIGYLTPRQTAQKSDPNTKQHDAIWAMANGEIIGVELELNSKWDRDLDEFVRKCVLSVRNNVSRIAVVSQSQAIIDRYKVALKPSAPYNIWQKNSAGRWVIEKKIAIPSDFPVSIFRKIEL